MSRLSLQKWTYYFSFIGWLILPQLTSAQDVSGFWLGVTYPNDPKYPAYDYTTSITQNGLNIRGTAQTANPNLPFGGLAYITGLFAGGRLTYKEANQNGNRNDQNVCYWDVSLTYDPATESLKGTYTNISNPPYCTETGGGAVELYRIRLKSGTTYCRNTSAKLEVTGRNIRWYDSPQKTRLLSTGNTYTTTVPQSTTLYVTQTVYKTESPAVPVEIKVIDLNITDVSVTDDSCGTAKVAVTATGSSALQYSMAGGPWQPSQTFQKVAPGTYKVSVKDLGGCQVDREGVTYQAKGLPQFTSVQVEPLKCGDATGRINVQASGGTGQLTVSLDGSSYQPLGPISARPGNYTLTLKDEAKCVVRQPVSVSAAASSLALTDVRPTSTSCGQNNARVEVQATAGRPPLTYALDGVTFQSSPVFEGVGAGTYPVTVRDADGCTTSQSVRVAGSSGPRIGQAMTSPAQCDQADGSVLVQANGGTGLTYALGGRPFQADPAFSGLALGTYRVTVRDESGCEVTDSVRVGTNCRDIIYIPTAFSPNGDGANESLNVFFPVDNLKIKRFSVFNRWGAAVFHRSEFVVRSGDVLWDGLGLSAQDWSGSFTYLLDVEFTNGEQYTYRSTLTLIK